MTVGTRAGVAHKAEFVVARGGERLYTQRWRPDGVARTVMVLAHGLGEHTGCYLPFAGHFAARGAAIYAHDHRGFGRSDGRRGHVERYERYVDDLHALVLRARAENPEVPLVLVGHSMGGTIALLYTLRYPEMLDRAVYSAPALMVGVPVSRWKRVVGHTMSRLYPTYTNAGITNPILLTRDPDLQRQTREDTIRHARRTARLSVEMFVRGPREVWRHARELRVPYLLLHGTEDPLVPVRSSRQLYALAAVPGRALRVYPDMRHEVFREIEREQVFADVAEWLAGQGIALDAAPRQKLLRRKESSDQTG